MALAPAPDDPPRDRTVVQNPRSLRGLAVMNVNPSVIDQYRLPLASAGILVVGIDGRARRSGLRRGDLILGVNGRAIGDVDGLEAALKSAGPLTLSVERKGRRGKIEFRG